MSDEQANEPQGREFSLQRIYVKDLSYETPNAPTVFADEWKPSFNLNLNSETKAVQQDLYEVVLTVTVTCKLGEKTAYLIEIQQAGLFFMRGFPQEEMGAMVGAYCPNILFPYAREVVSDLVSKGSFPQLLLTPVNFDMLYAQHQAQLRQRQQGGGEGVTTH